MKEFNESNEFKKFKFYSRDRQQILQAVSLLEKLGYEVGDGFSVYDAACHNGIGAWDDGEITEGWLDAYSDFEQVTLEDLKEMVGENKEVLWLNKETMEESYLDKFSVFPYNSFWVKVPEGATFATGDKDNFVFRKDGWYYDIQTGFWVKGDVNLQDLYKHEFVKLFWVKGGKENLFTLERLLGCEVKISYSGVTGYVTDVTNNGYFLHICCSSSFDVVSKYHLKFFTEDGDELTFDEYVNMYYGGSCV